MLFLTLKILGLALLAIVGVAFVGMLFVGLICRLSEGCVEKPEEPDDLAELDAEMTKEIEKWRDGK